MKVPSLNLGAWLQRLGVRRPGWSPEFGEHISPVAIVADHRHQAAPLPTREGMVTLAANPIPAQYVSVELQCNAPGGMRIKELFVGNTTTLSVPYVQIGVFPYRWLAAGNQTAVWSSDPRAPLRCTTANRANAVALYATAPGHWGESRPDTVLYPVHTDPTPGKIAFSGGLRDLFVPPGGGFIIETDAVLQGFRALCTVVEYE